MSYGTGLAPLIRRTAYFVDKILRGANPADVPVEQPTTFDFIINQKTDQALPDAEVAPEPVALVGRLPFAELERHVPPGGVRAHDPEDPTQDRAVVVARPAGWWPLGRQERTDPLPFDVGQLCGPGCRRLWCEPDERTIPPPSPSLGMAPCGDGL